MRDFKQDSVMLNTLIKDIKLERERSNPFPEKIRGLKFRTELSYRQIQSLLEVDYIFSLTLNEIARKVIQEINIFLGDNRLEAVEDAGLTSSSEFVYDASLNPPNVYVETLVHVTI